MSRYYLSLVQKFETLSNLYNAAAILGWDNSVMMPEGASADRGRQFSTIYAICHQIETSEEYKNLLDKTEEEIEKNPSDFSDWQKANIKLARHNYIHSTAIDEKLLKASTEASQECEMRWRLARADNDFKTYALFLKPVLKYTREIAAAKADKLNLSKYDALLDGYDRGRRAAQIEPLFAELKKFLPSFADEVIEKQNSQIVTPHSLRGRSGDKNAHQPRNECGVTDVGCGIRFPIEKQRELGVFLMQRVGFDFERGRLDVSHHPFSGGTPSDTRITTRYDENNYLDSFMSVMHETGHAMYEAGLPRDYIYQPVGCSLGMTIHESQSLLIEMQVCRSKEFINYFSTILPDYFPASEGFFPENLYRKINHVERSLIRVGADEVTYPLHVIIRFEIERALIEGKMEIDDLPSAWNKAYKDVLGVDVPNDKDGCMQDIHWAGGSFGYFPTYTLGAMCAAQFFATAKKTYPEIPSELSKGNFNKLMTWLRENIHSKGSLYSPDELVKQVTGQGINVEFFKEYLKNKYLK